MKRINTQILKKGDIVLTTSPEKPSTYIKFVTSSDISHAMICVSNLSVMDATGEGVHARNPQKILYPDDCAIYILRLKEPLNDELTDKIINYVRSETGTPYTNLEAIGSLLKIGDGTKKQYCSRLVARAFNSVGVSLVKNPNYCTPEELKSSKLLLLIDNTSEVINDQEVEELKNEGDNTQGMRNVTNELLKKAIKLDKSIKDITNLIKVSIESPNKDDQLANILQESGYLNFCETDVLKYPWRYDQIEIVKMYNSSDSKEQLLNYCKQTIADDREGAFNHWRIQEAQLRELYAQHKRKTISLLIELYFNLNLQHYTPCVRIVVASKIN